MCRHEPLGGPAFTWPVQGSPPGKLYLWDWSLNPPPRGRRCSRTGKRGTRGERQQQASHVLHKDTKNKPNQKNQHKEQPNQKNPNVAGGGRGGGRREKRRKAVASLHPSFSFRPVTWPPHSETVAWMEGWLDEQRRLLPSSSSSPALVLDGAKRK